MEGGTSCPGPARGKVHPIMVLPGVGKEGIP